MTDTADISVLPLDAFVRAVGIKKHSRHAMFLGAGSSITSGTPPEPPLPWAWPAAIAGIGAIALIAMWLVWRRPVGRAPLGRSGPE